MEKKERSINWGIIGCGDVVEHKSGPSIVAAHRSRLLAVVSRRDMAKAADFCKKLGAERAYNRIEDMLSDDDIDAVYIATPPFLHKEQTILAAEAGKHVLCEKPMAMNADECREMIQACKANGVELSVAFYRRCWPVTKKVHELIETGEIGTPVGAAVQIYSGWNPADEGNWRLDRSISGGGALADMGSHWIDLLLHFLGDVDSESAILDGFSKHDTETHASILLRFANSAQAYLTCQWGTAVGLNSFEIIGTEGRITIPEFASGEIEHKTPEGTSSLHFPPPENTHRGLIQEFIACILDGMENPLSGDEGMKTSWVLDDALRSSQESMIVKSVENY